MLKVQNITLFIRDVLGKKISSKEVDRSWQRIDNEA